MVFRADFLKSRVGQPRWTGEQSLSRLCGEAWKALPPGEKKRYIDLAAEEKRRHAEMYPDYRYKPGPRRKKGRAAGNKRPKRTSPIASSSEASTYSDEDTSMGEGSEEGAEGSAEPHRAQ